MKTILKSCCPIITGQYWYITAYFGMAVFAPFLQIVIRRCSLEQFLITMLTGYILIGLLPLITFQDPASLGIRSGYSAFWLTYLYLLGAGIREFRLLDKLSKSWSIAGFFLSCLLVFSSKLLITFIFHRFGLANIFISYISPFILLNAVLLLSAFSKWSVKSLQLKRTIQLLAPAALGVYLIHDQRLVRGFFITDKFTFLVQQPPYLLVLGVIVSALVIYTICTVIELGRIYLFKLLRINVLANKLADWLHKLCDLVVRQIEKLCPQQEHGKLGQDA